MEKKVLEQKELENLKQIRVDFENLTSVMGSLETQITLINLEKNEVIDIDNYERYWDNSTPNGHQIRILKQDNSTLTINLEWPKGYNPRLREVKKR